jgi:predicted RND superfamily exporter protein
LNRDDTALTRHLITRLEQYVSANPSEHLRVTLAGGVAPTMLAVNEHTVNAKLANIAVVFGVIFVIASILLRTPLGGFYVTAPLAMALIVNLGLFAWLGIAFDLGGASIAAIGVSIGADYAIYFLYRLREEYRRTAAIDEAFRATMETTGRAVLFVALAISAGFAVYMASDFYTFYIVGFFVPLTMMVSSITALTLLPALVLLMRPRFIFGSAPPTGVPEPTPAASRRVIVGPPF